MKTLSTYLILLLLTACSTSEKHVESKNDKFRIPIFTQPPTKDTIYYRQPDHLTHIFPDFLGKFSFADTIHLSGQPDTIRRKDEIEERNILMSDSFKMDGFQLLTDYKTTLYYKESMAHYGYYSYPVFVVNETQTPKGFIAKDSHVFAIQEALDTNGRWRPIEGRGFDFCGNGYFGLKVYPGEFVTFLFPKYQGDYKTKLRVRLSLGDNLYVSKPFEGTIALRQFNLKKDDYLYDELVKDKSSAIRSLFYGGQPLGIE